MKITAFLMAFLLIGTPAFSLSIEPSLFNVSMYPGEHVTFAVNVTDAEFVIARPGTNMTCLFDGNQSVLQASSQSFIANVTLSVDKDAETGNYVCNIAAQKFVEVQSMSGINNGGQGYSYWSQCVIDGLCVIIPANLTLALPVQHAEILTEELKSNTLTENAGNVTIITRDNITIPSLHEPVGNDMRVFIGGIVHVLIDISGKFLIWLFGLFH